MSDQPENTAVQFRIEVPESLEAGVYSNFTSVWTSPHDMTLDFAVTRQAEQHPEQHGTVVVPASVVARVKIPITMVQDLLHAISVNIGTFEDAVGPIRRPGDNRPLYPPEEERP